MAESRISPLPLEPGSLYALGSSIAIDGRVSWYPATAAGHAPVNSYLLLDDDDALLIDTGVSVQREVLLAQLAELLGGRPLSILHTRIAEFDGACNTVSIMERFRVRRLYATFSSQRFIYFRSDRERAPAAVDEEILRDGARLPIGGVERVEVIKPALRLLTTVWLYDQRTRTLFTSDSFGQALHDRPTGPRALDAAHSAASAAAAYDHMLAKFDWLATADTAPIAAWLAALQERLEIETIAPGYGLILRGRDVVREHLDAMIAALAPAAVGSGA